MRNFRQSKWLTGGIVLIALVAWLLASNHCGLAVMASLAKTPAAHACCHQDDAQAPVHTAQCCDSLSAPLPQGAVAPDVVWHDAAALAALALVILPEQGEPLVISSHDLPSPPGPDILVSVVLKRATPSLAPPQIA